MIMTIESTGQIVEISSGQSSVEARVWEGVTESGVPVVCLVTRIAVRADAGDEVHERFREELDERAAPSPAATEAFPARLVL